MNIFNMNHRMVGEKLIRRLRTDLEKRNGQKRLHHIRKISMFKFVKLKIEMLCFE